MAEKKKAILLRIPSDLSDALHRWAQDELRSVNAQIEYLLREALRKRRSGRREEQPPNSDKQRDNQGTVN
ncbi:MAG: Arc family DNA-binding protein [Phycisphaerae bacterium]|nr:Arc family DNA-binding protein [Phycisphaerae bacterium]